MKEFQEKLVLIGLVKDCAGYIEKNIENIDKVFGGFTNRQWLLVEYDSKDESVFVIRKLSNKYNLHFIPLGSIEAKYTHPSDLNAYCKNVALEHLFKEKNSDNLEFVCMVDLGGGNNLLNRANITKAFNESNQWDACFPNQAGPYYDIWSLRHPQWNPNDCWVQYRWLVNKNTGQNRAMWNAVFSKMIFLDPDENAIPVDSAFGGLGLYKWETIINNYYSSHDSDGSQTSEHVPFNLRIKSKGFRLFILPYLINCGWNEHSELIKKFYNHSNLIQFDTLR